jgi:cytoskeletal protein RodZ
VIQIGPSLAAARRARGLELRDAEQLTCLRSKYLAALEDERYYDLPGRTYARAFLRTYANALGLDADKLVAEFDEQFPELAEEPIALPPPKQRRVRADWRLAPVAAVLAIAVALVWSAWRGNQTPKATSFSPPAVAAAATESHVRAAHKTITQRPSALVIRATDGPCWVLARRDDASGALLAQQTLQPGQTLRLSAPHVWLRLGAPWNASVHRGTHAAQLGTTQLPLNIVL